MTKPIIVVKMPCKLLYVYHSSKKILNGYNFLPYLISKFLVACDHLLYNNFFSILKVDDMAATSYVTNTNSYACEMLT